MHVDRSAGSGGSAESLARLGFNRGSSLGGAHGPGHREWLHFCVHAGDAALIANFSAFAQPAADGPGEVAVPRLAVIAYRADRWAGAIETAPPGEWSLPGGAFGARFGGSAVALAGDDVHLRVDSPRAGVYADVRLSPCGPAAPSHNVAVVGSPPLNWVVVPRLLATGALRIDGSELALERAPAYHDHNWGAFRWGADFRWEWGYALPDDAAVPWAVVAVRLTNRARTVVLEQGVLVWRGETLARTFRGDEVEYAACGLLRRAPAVSLPAALALVRAGSATDVPARARFAARGRGDWLEVDFVPDAVARILVPNDVRTGVTTVHEARSRIAVRGQIRGEAVEYASSGFLELLGG